MTVAERMAFVQRFGDFYPHLLASVDVILCPPFAALHPMSEALACTPVDVLGAGRRGRDPDVSAELLRVIAQERGSSAAGSAHQTSTPLATSSARE